MQEERIAAKPFQLPASQRQFLQPCAGPKTNKPNKITFQPQALVLCLAFKWLANLIGE